LDEPSFESYSELNINAALKGWFRAATKMP